MALALLISWDPKRPPRIGKNILVIFHIVFMSKALTSVCSHFSCIIFCLQLVCAVVDVCLWSVVV